MARNIVLRLTAREVRLLTHALDLLNVVVPYHWHSERALMLKCARSLQDRLDRLVEQMSRLEMNGVALVPPAAPRVPEGAKLSK